MPGFHAVFVLKRKSHLLLQVSLSVVGGLLFCVQTPGLADETSQSPGIAPAPLEAATPASPTTAPPDPTKQAVATPLFVMVRQAKFTGWEDLCIQAFRIEKARIVVDLDQALSPDVKEKSVSFPVSSGNLIPLEEFRCKAIVQKVFQRGNRFITIRAFEFEEPEGANAGYDLLRKGSTTVLKRGDGSSEDGVSISFWQDSFLFLITGTEEDDDEAKEVMTSFATHLSKTAITHAQPPAILSRLPVVDRVRGSEKIVMGPVTAARFFNAPELGALSIEKARGAAVADYQIFEPARERLKLLYIDYGDDKLANAAYNDYFMRMEQLRPADKVWPGENRALFRLNKTFLLFQVKPHGRLIVVAGARKSKSPMLLSAEIR